LSGPSEKGERGDNGLNEYYYDTLRGLHILAVIAWMAGLLYLPRLYAYHTRATPGSEMDITFKTMERKLLSIIMTPAMIVAWTFGLLLLAYRTDGFKDPGLILHPWLATKLVGVVLMTTWHHFLAVNRRKFANDLNIRTERFWRMVNEIPFILAIVMVLAVTTEFGH
jgi:putative membrane protein